jgi:hypothetical protein
MAGQIFLPINNPESAPGLVLIEVGPDVRPPPTVTSDSKTSHSPVKTSESSRE